MHTIPYFLWGLLLFPAVFNCLAFCFTMALWVGATVGMYKVIFCLPHHCLQCVSLGMCIMTVKIFPTCKSHQACAAHVPALKTSQAGKHIIASVREQFCHATSLARILLKVKANSSYIQT